MGASNSWVPSALDGTCEAARRLPQGREFRQNAHIGSDQDSSVASSTHTAQAVTVVIAILLAGCSSSTVPTRVNDSFESETPVLTRAAWNASQFQDAADASNGAWMILNVTATPGGYVTGFVLPFRMTGAEYDYESYSLVPLLNATTALILDSITLATFDLENGADLTAFTYAGTIRAASTIGSGYDVVSHDLSQPIQSRAGLPSGTDMHRTGLLIAAKSTEAMEFQVAFSLTDPDDALAAVEEAGKGGRWVLVEPHGHSEGFDLAAVELVSASDGCSSPAESIALRWVGSVSLQRISTGECGLRQTLALNVNGAGWTAEMAGHAFLTGNRSASLITSRGSFEVETISLPVGGTRTATDPSIDAAVAYKAGSGGGKVNARDYATGDLRGHHADFWLAFALSVPLDALLGTAAVDCEAPGAYPDSEFVGYCRGVTSSFNWIAPGTLS